MSKPLWMWVIFILIIGVLLVLDLGVFHKKEKEIGIKESLWMSGFYMLMAFLFGLGMWSQLGIQSFAEYLTGFLVEKSLALDNIFVISVIFTSLSIPIKFQYRVLFWGILGVIVLRGIMIGLGAHLISQFSWILHVFALFMIVTGIKMFFVSDQKMDIQNNSVLKWMRQHFRITKELRDQKFFVRQEHPATKKTVLFMTPLFVTLIFVEMMDLVFAVDSIPAIFTITKDPYIVYTSNIFAILGLRALYFALATMMDRFHYLKFALAAVLIFIGSKVFIVDWMDIEKFPPLLSLSVTFSLLTFGCVYSFYRSKTH